MDIKNRMTAANLFIIGITIFVIYIIFSIGLDIFPRWGVPWSKPFVSKVNSVLLNVSYSYLAGLIFYIFISYMPELSQKKRFQPIIKRDILRIHSLFLDMVNSMHSERGKEPFSNIPSFEMFEELMENISPNDIYPNTKGQVTEASYLKTFLYLRVETIEIIKHIHLFKSHASDKIILLLEDLDNSELFKVVVMWNSWRGGVLDQNMKIFAKSFYDGFRIVKALKEEAAKLK